MISRKLVQKAKQILENETGTVLKSWGGKHSVCLIYPNTYHVGMSNLGFQTLYRLFNQEEDIVCERAFLPNPADLGDYQQTQTPLFSLESQKPLSDFDLLAFSVSFENDFLNLLAILNLSRIPAESCYRRESHPLIIAGGAAVFLNPEPLSEIIDLFILGEAEEVIDEFFEVYRKAMGRKDELLRKSGRLEGVYVPAFYHIRYSEGGKIEAMEPDEGFPRRVRRRWVKEIDRVPTQSTLFTQATEFKDMVLVEVNRGCPRGCRFCAACFIYHPFRNRSLQLLQSLSREILSKEGRIGLTGTAVSDHPALLSLCRDILAQKGGISLASLRVDAVSDALIECLKKSGDRTATIAPEAGSERLRRLLRKGYDEEQILKAVDVFMQNDLFQIKGYFMIGLPSETEGDVEAILHLAKRIRHHILSSRGKGKEGWRLVLSVNPFIPKPATPFQWEPLEEVGELKRKLKILQKGLRGERGIKMIHDLPKWAYIQALVSRGDRRVGKILMAAHRHQGDWGKALRETSINPDFFVYRRRDLDEVFPWDFIDHGIPKEKLREEYLSAMKEAGIKIQ